MRRTKEDAARTRASIMEAALLCFDRHGIAGSTLDQIAGEAKVTKGAVYHHFGGKRQILHELRERVSLPMLDEADTELLHARELPALDRVENFLLGILDSLENDKRKRRTLAVMQFKCEYVDDLSGLRRRLPRGSQGGRARQAPHARDRRARDRDVPEWPGAPVAAARRPPSAGQGRAHGDRGARPVAARAGAIGGELPLR